MASITAPATATAQATPTLKLKGAKHLKVDGSDPSFGDWRDDLILNGYAVVRGAVPRDRALNYADRMLSLLESL